MFVDGAADLDVRIRQVDRAGDVPCGIVAVVGNVDTVVQGRILVNGYARKQRQG